MTHIGVKQGCDLTDNQNVAGDLANTTVASATGNARKLHGDGSGKAKRAMAADDVSGYPRAQPDVPVSVGR